MRNFIIIAGLVACIVLVAYWVNVLSEIEIGVYVPEAGESGWGAGRGAYWRDPEGFGPGLSPEAAAEKRSQVNTTYGLWLAATIGITAGLFYIVNEKDKSNKELKTWYEAEGKKEKGNLLNENGVNVHKFIKEKVVKLKEKNPEWSLNKLVEQLYKEGYVGLDKNSVKKILDQGYDLEKAEKERLKEKVFKIREEHPEWSFYQLLDYLNKEEYFCVDEKLVKNILNQTDDYSGLDTEEKSQLTEKGKEIAELKTKLKKLENMVGKEEDRSVPAEKEIIDCPYCLEQIYAGAIKCKHCKTDLT